jgi:hypothetical protein
MEMKNYKRAHTFYQAALLKEVAGQDQRDKIKKLSERSLKKLRHAHTGN